MNCDVWSWIQLLLPYRQAIGGVLELGTVLSRGKFQYAGSRTVFSSWYKAEKLLLLQFSIFEKSHVLARPGIGSSICTPCGTLLN